MSAVKSPVAVAFGSIFFVGMAALCVYWAAASAIRGELPTAFTVLMLATMCVGLLAQFALATWGTVVVRAHVDELGTVLRADRRIDLIYRSTVVAGFAAVVVYALFSPMGKIAIPMPPVVHTYIAIGAVIGVLIGVPTLWKLFTRGGKSRLRLSPHGFELSAGVFVQGAWDDVRDILDHPLRGRPPARGVLVIVLSNGKAPLLESDAFTPGGHALLRMVRFYWLHPEHRGELTDDRAITRLREDLFDELPGHP